MNSFLFLSGSVLRLSCWEEVGRGHTAAQVTLTIGSCIQEKSARGPEVTGLHK